MLNNEKQHESLRNVVVFVELAKAVVLLSEDFV